jgi:serine/threonine protein kinase
MTTHFARQEIAGYQLGLAQTLSPTQGAALVKLLSQPCDGRRSTLSGRRSASYGELPGYGRVVIKHYHRGGLFGRLVRSLYVRWGKTRSQAEFEVLDRARALGVPVPEPVAYIYRGTLLYRAWLVTKEVSEHESLAQLVLRDEEAARTVTEQLSDIIALLVEAKIYHVDLHPGNVLIDRDGKIFLIDFDKAHDYPGSKNDLRDNYLIRWRRAVIKHNLPDCLCEILSATLRRTFA